MTKRRHHPREWANLDWLHCPLCQKFYRDGDDMMWHLQECAQGPRSCAMPTRSVMRSEKAGDTSKASRSTSFNIPIHHAWNLSEDGIAYDTTWPHGERPTAYLGVEFSIGRADDATWNGDATVLDDYNRRWPLLKEEWHGEDFAKVWPKTDAMKIMLGHLRKAGAR